MTAERPTCPACGTPHERGKLLCKTCWFAVPAPLRREVNASWRAYRGLGVAADATEKAREALP